MLAIRPTTSEDIPLILQFIRDLAEFEREPQAAVATAEDLMRDGFDPAQPPKFRCVIADWDGKPAGFAFWYYTYSTWLGRQALYLEDLFVRPDYRGKGIGKALLVHLAQIAKDENCFGMRWQVLDWNQPAIDFYENMGAQVLREWLPVRIMGEPMLKLSRTNNG